jgi:hypothetical protein
MYMHISFKEPLLNRKSNDFEQHPNVPRVALNHPYLQNLLQITHADLIVWFHTRSLGSHDSDKDVNMAT